MDTTWVVVCDAAQARIFEVSDDATWHQVEAFEHAASRAKSSDIASDKLGQRSSEGGSVHHGALAPASAPKEVEKEHFAHQLANVLHHGLDAHRFARFALVAPPHFLGLVKGELSTQVTKHLFKTVDKDLVGRTVDELKKALHEPLEFPAEHGKHPKG
jgi:protein required for attachment to host cells